MKSVRLQAEQLEDRLTPYALTGYDWISPRITYSFAPTGTPLLGSNTAPGDDTYLNREFSQAWKDLTLAALDRWHEVANIDFVQVPDNGDSQYTVGPFQGDARFGDIRFLARPFLEPDLLGFTTSSRTGLLEDLTVNTTNATSNGDVAINTEKRGANILNVLIHEIGHALGLGHTNRFGTIMYPFGTDQTILSGDDIAGVQKIYGARPGSPGLLPPAVFNLQIIKTRAGAYMVWDGNNSDHYIVQRWHRGQWRNVAIADDGPYFRLPRIVRRTWYRVIGVGFDGTLAEPIRVLVSPSIFLRRFTRARF